MGNLSQHGFARNTVWNIKETRVDQQDQVRVVLQLEDSKDTHKVWNHAFSVEYIVTLMGDQLETELLVRNKNTTESFTFTCALHTYFRVGNVQKAAVVGLDGLSYTDKLQNGKEFKQEGNFVQFTGEVDRVYYNVPNKVKIVDASKMNRIILLKKENFDDCVVWNPHVKKV